MRKAERKRLAEQTLQMLKSYGATDIASDTWENGELHYYSTTLTSSEYGRIGVTAYLPNNTKGIAWLACRFLDWDASPGQHWRGWSHWKNNVYQDGPSMPAFDWLVDMEHHLDHMALSQREHATQ